MRLFIRIKDRIRAILSGAGRLPSRATHAVVAHGSQARSRLAPLHRRVIRGAIVVLGFAVFAASELLLARLVDQGNWFFIGMLAGVLLAIVTIAVSPTWGFIYWLFFSPFAKYFVKRWTPFAIDFDVLSLGLLALAMTVRAMLDRSRPKLTPVEYLMIASFVYAMVLRNSSFATPIFLSQVVLSPLVIYFLAKSAIVKREHISLIVVAVLLVGMSWALLGIYETINGKSWLSPVVGTDVAIQTHQRDVGAGRTTGPAGHYYLYGNVLILSLLIALHKAGWSKKSALKVLYYALCPVLLLGLYFGYSRAPYSACVLALLVSLVLARASFKRYLAMATLVFIAIGCMAPYWLSDKTLSKRLEGSPSARFAGYVTAMNMVRAHPFFGVGKGKFVESVPEYVSGREHLFVQRSPYSLISLWAGPHSEYFGILAEQGFIGAILHFGTLIGFIVLMYRIRAKLPSHGFYGQELVNVVIAFTFGVMLTMVSDELQTLFYMYGIMFTMYAAVVRLGQMQPEEDETEPTKPGTRPMRRLSAAGTR